MQVDYAFLLKRAKLAASTVLGPGAAFCDATWLQFGRLRALAANGTIHNTQNKFIILDSFEKCWAAREGSSVSLASFGQSRSGRSRHFCRTAPLPRHRHLLALLLLYTLQASDQAQ